MRNRKRSGSTSFFVDTKGLGSSLVLPNSPRLQIPEDKSKDYGSLADKDLASPDKSRQKKHKGYGSSEEELDALDATTNIPSGSKRVKFDDRIDNYHPSIMNI